MLLEDRMKPEYYLHKQIREVSTPSLILDITALEHNLGHMVKVCNKESVRVRNHVKTTKSSEIARMMAIESDYGITTATLNEAYAMWKANVTNDILIANKLPLTQSTLEAVAGLSEMTSSGLIVSVDSLEQAMAYSDLMSNRDAVLGVLVEIDVGLNRFGVRTAEDAVKLYREIEKLPNVKIRGLMAYEGGHIDNLDVTERKDRYYAEMKPLHGALRLLGNGNVEIVSTSGTRTFELAINDDEIRKWEPQVREVQVGTYATNDLAYRRYIPDFKTALYVLANVIGFNGDGEAILDVGNKRLSIDHGDSEIMRYNGVLIQGRVEYHSGRFHENNSFVMLDPDYLRMDVGGVVTILPSHGCTTIPLHDAIFGYRVDLSGNLLENKVERVFPIDAR